MKKCSCNCHEGAQIPCKIFWSKTTYEISKIGQNCPSLLNNVTLVSRFRAKVQKCPCHCYEGAKNAHVKFFSAKLPVKFQK